MIAAGIGVTPFRALLEALPLRPGEATLIYRAHDAESLLFGEELAELADRRGIELILLTGPRRSPLSWLPATTELDDRAALLAWVPDVADRDVLLCGPGGWVASVRRAAQAAGVAARDVHTEEFSW